MTGRPKIVVIGAGLAGAATAYFLALEDACEVTLLEREPIAGRHSSGRNAAMVRQIVGEARVAPFARDGARFIRSFAGESSGFSFARVGSLLLAAGPARGRLLASAEAAAAGGVGVEVLSPDEAVRLVPVLDPATFEVAVRTPSDGVVDVANLLQFFLREGLRRGVVHRFTTEATGLVVEGDAVKGVRTAGGTLAADAVVDAGGAWAGRLLAHRAPELTPMKRHLFVTGSLPWADRRWPWVWDVGREVYFRPETPGLLLSACDECPAEPGLPQADPQVAELLSTKLAAAFPGLGDLSIARSWAGLRTFAADRAFRVGPDPEVQGLFWAAGLGGHGVTCSAAVGAACASSVGEGVLDLPPRRNFLEFFTAGHVRAGAA